MKKTRTGKTLLILAVVAVLGIGSYARMPTGEWVTVAIWASAVGQAMVRE